MNSTNSEFWGYIKDKYTTLQEAYDRILATSLSTWWRYNWTGDEQRMPHWEKSYEQVQEAHAPGVRGDVLALAPADAVPNGFADHQQPQRDRRGPLLAPNKHHFLLDLSAFGLENDAKDGASTTRPTARTA